MARTEQVVSLDQQMPLIAKVLQLVGYLAGGG